MSSADEIPEELSPREAAHTRHRDRKLRTEMVVDNAGIKKITLALHDRAALRKGNARPTKP